MEVDDPEFDELLLPPLPDELDDEELPDELEIDESEFDELLLPPDESEDDAELPEPNESLDDEELENEGIVKLQKRKTKKPIARTLPLATTMVAMLVRPMSCGQNR